MSERRPSKRRLVLQLGGDDFGSEGGWRRSSADPATQFTDAMKRRARIAERGIFDTLFLGDFPELRDAHRGPFRPLEPTAALASVSAAVPHIGLISTLSSTYNDPVDLAAKVLSLNMVSGGRAAWNIVTTLAVSVSHNYGFEEHPNREDRYQHAHRFVEQVLALWQASDADLRPSHRPVLVQAGGSIPGMDLAGRFADVWFTTSFDIESARQNYEAIKQAAGRHGRPPESIVVLPTVTLCVGRTSDEARDRMRAVVEETPSSVVLKRVGAILGADLTVYDPDSPLPQDVVREILSRPLSEQRGHGAQKTLRDALARDERRTLREISESVIVSHSMFVGSVDEVADRFQQWFESGACDGFSLGFDVVPDGLELFVDEVIPRLQERGVAAESYAEDVGLAGRLATAAGTEPRALPDCAPAGATS